MSAAHFRNYTFIPHFVNSNHPPNLLRRLAWLLQGRKD